MLDLEQLQILAQLTDNTDVSLSKLGKAYSQNDAEEFAKAKKEIIDIQKKISTMTQ